MNPEHVFPSTPCNRLFGFRLVHRAHDRVVIELPVRPEFAQEEGIVQGGILCALADTAAVWLLWPDLPRERAMTGVECSMRFLSPAIADAGPLVATATPLRIGGTIAVCESLLQQDGRSVAKGAFTFLMRERRPPRESPR